LLPVISRGTEKLVALAVALDRDFVQFCFSHNGDLGMEVDTKNKNGHDK